MPNPKLAMIGGFPGSGKSVLSKRVSRRLHIPRISFDDLRAMFYNKRYPDYIAKDCGLQKRYATSDEEESVVQQTAKNLSLYYLSGGLSVLVDSTFSNNPMRGWFADTKEIESGKHLFVAQVNPEVLKERLSKRGNQYRPETVDIWMKRWEEPTNHGYKTIILPNNTGSEYKKNVRKVIGILSE